MGRGNRDTTFDHARLVRHPQSKRAVGKQRVGSVGGQMPPMRGWIEMRRRAEEFHRVHEAAALRCRSPIMRATPATLGTS